MDYGIITESVEEKYFWWFKIGLKYIFPVVVS